MLLSDTDTSFTETTVVQLRDYSEWHCGRSRYAIWMIPINCPAILDYIDRVTASLADLLHPSRRQPHITLFVCGFEEEAVIHNDDFTPAQLQRQLADLDRLSLPPCDLRIGALDSFSSAAFLAVGDPQGHLPRWRETLAASCTEIRQAAYVPHITLGLYRQSISAEDLRRRLAQLPVPDGLSLPVERLEYVTYRSDDMFSPLECQQQVRCQTKSD
ncbi:2'-5' RNA ligase superfamily protein [Halopseudomonas litoralis]|uniref:2'-5' RNA ligase superfamily protein n=1 Tax=Halopseudomonas litoralis TaxID=797277 RepID=A0A1H1MEC3_9GAMM|nr:2'-5' RNA ligase family protein [Halopseudomonas litoralis]SDR84715.1 2'-5' RNA ligase superfamily protein [Halopseudomonas litoralis]